MTLATKAGGWVIPETLITELEVVYGGAAVERELSKARLWLEANPTRRKTARGMPRFLVSWLNRATEGATMPQKPRLTLQPSSYSPWVCPHTPACSGRYVCGLKG